MIQKKTPYEEAVTIDLLHERGYGLGVLETGEPVGVYGALPGEVVIVEVGKRKKRLRIGGVLEVLQAHTARIVPHEAAFLSTSPLQIVGYDWENTWKKEWIVGEFEKYDIVLPIFEMTAPAEQYGYRNKVEFAFFSDDDGLSLAFHQRGSNWGKIKVEGSKLLHPTINFVAQKIMHWLSQKSIHARQLKSLQLNYSWHTNSVVVSLFIKVEHLSFESAELIALLGDNIQGLLIVFSDPQAPDNRITTIEHAVGNTILTEKIGGILYEYDFDMFFQSNVPGFSVLLDDLVERLQKIPQLSEKNVLDLYAGVGTIGIRLARLIQSVVGVEIMSKSMDFAIKNATQNHLTNYTFCQVAAEKMDISLFENKDIVIVDPPRSGLSDQSIAQILDAKPEYLVYISCNPATQARDTQKLLEKYDIVYYVAHNLYPRTMHCEGVLLLKAK